MIPELRELSETVRFQRENFDGSGGPRGLNGDQIPVSSRIIRVADEYDLLTNPRNSALAADHEDAIATLRDRASRELDPNVVRIFLEIAPSNLIESPPISGEQIETEIPTHAVN